ncbi:hypothetical protein GCM10007350_22130 [Jeongeupia chitinilytica]|uniref:Mu-like prophage FluMu N-terminal domain-containing protein n=2 Tax=Jeongeupia chitinilytica TaxID=1041641 RepID=A0ABQ3H0W7_9NEIS|nr:hypothetical protein GCM10007350_22130 [Jeongeupia chitinilytica]
MAERKTKDAPATPAEGELQQSTSIEGQQQPTTMQTDTASAGESQGQSTDSPIEVKPASAGDSSVAELFGPDAIKVVAKCEYFRRAGRVFSREPETIRLDALREGDLELLMGEPMLVVTPARIGEAG